MWLGSSVRNVCAEEMLSSLSFKAALDFSRSSASFFRAFSVSVSLSRLRLWEARYTGMRGGG